MFDKTPLVLASSSPRRHELFVKLGYEFEIVTSPVQELDATSRGSLWNAPTELATLNAQMKASAVSSLRPESLVIGADTIVELNGNVFGKPKDLAEARQTLSLLSGRVHHVLTGIVIVIGGRVETSFCECTSVKFKALSSQDIEAYLVQVHVLDKAGAYAAQEEGALIIESIQGSMNNVIGLPTERLDYELKRLLRPV
jgi:septum formation protein